MKRGPVGSKDRILALAASATLGVVFASLSAAEAPKHEGRIVNAETNEPISFVNVGIPEAGIGTVSSEDGLFSLSGAADDAIVFFSAIGYESRRVPLKTFPQDGVIPLKPVEFGFREEVSVSAEANEEPIVMGRQYKVPGYGFGFGNDQLGSEVAAHIKIRERILLESANFIVTRTGGERFLYRVNVYDFTDGKIGKNLLERNVIVSAKQERGTLGVDLREHLLVVEDDVLLSLEWIRADEEMGNSRIMFRAKPRAKSSLYFKPTSQMEFVKVPRHGLGFFLTGYRLPD